MKEAVEMKGQSTETEKDRFPVGNPDFRHAMRFFDALMRRATEAQNQNAVLETMVLTNEVQYIKDTDEMFNEWRAYTNELFNKWRTYNQAQRTKAQRIFEVCKARIKIRDTKIETLQAEVERQKQKLKARDAHLATVERRWAQQRVFLEGIYQMMQEGARKIGEELRVNFGSSVCDDNESDYGAEERDEEDDEDEEAKATGIAEEEEEEEEEG